MGNYDGEPLETIFFAFSQKTKNGEEKWGTLGDTLSDSRPTTIKSTSEL